VRWEFHVIRNPPPLSLLSSVIVKLLSQADQVPYQGGELAFWKGDTVIPNNRELIKISKKNTRNGLILKGEKGDSSSFHCT
jgi:hypothetical protein